MNFPWAQTPQTSEWVRAAISGSSLNAKLAEDAKGECCEKCKHAKKDCTCEKTASTTREEIELFKAAADQIADELEKAANSMGIGPGAGPAAAPVTQTNTSGPVIIDTGHVAGHDSVGGGTVSPDGPAQPANNENRTIGQKALNFYHNLFRRKQAGEVPVEAIRMAASDGHVASILERTHNASDEQKIAFVRDLVAEYGEIKLAHADAVAILAKIAEEPAMAPAMAEVQNLPPEQRETMLRAILSGAGKGALIGGGAGGGLGALLGAATPPAISRSADAAILGGVGGAMVGAPVGALVGGIRHALKNRGVQPGAAAPAELPPEVAAQIDPTKMAAHITNDECVAFFRKLAEDPATAPMMQSMEHLPPEQQETLLRAILSGALKGGLGGAGGGAALGGGAAAAMAPAGNRLIEGGAGAALGGLAGGALGAAGGGLYGGLSHALRNRQPAAAPVPAELLAPGQPGASDGPPKIAAPIALIRKLAAEVGPGKGPTALQVTQTGQPGPLPEGGAPAGATGLVASNQAAIDATKRDAKAPEKKDMAGVVEPAMQSAQTDTVLRQALKNDGGAKIASVSEAALRVGAGKMILSQLAGET
jgi:hypothetical protein